MMADIPRIKRNIQKMIDQNAPEREIDSYLSSEGVTADQLRQPSHRQAETESMASLEASPPEYSPPSEITRMTRGYITRPSALALGGTAGGVLGAPLAVPSFGTSVVGGAALGAGAGGQAYDFFENMARRAAGRPLLKGGVAGAFRRAGSDIAEEAAWTGGATAAGPLLKAAGKPLLGKVLGVNNPAARRATDLAAVQGIDLGAAHVSKRKMVRGAPTVLGVFPFVGTPLRRGQTKVVGQLDDAAADLLNTLAPVQSTAADVGETLTKAAGRRYNKANRVASALYKRFYSLADDLPVKDIVPTDPLKAELADIQTKMAKGDIVLTSGDRMAGYGADTLGEWLKQIEGLPGRITVEQARNLERTFNQVVRKASSDGFDISRLAGMKGAMETAKNSLDVSRLSPQAGEQVLSAWQKANAFFHQSRKPFETATGKRFGRVDKNIFGRGVFKPGTINQDQVFEAVFQAKSPEALRDLEKLVGPDQFRKASRQFLENAFKSSRVPAKEGAIVEDMFSAAAFEKRLGLDTQQGWDAMKEILKGSPVKVNDWRNFLESAKSATDITIRDPSKFLTRRLILGGSILGGVVMAGGKVTLPVAAMIAASARGGAKFLMSANQLKQMTRVIQDTATDQQKRALILRILNNAEKGNSQHTMHSNRSQ